MAQLMDSRIIGRNQKITSARTTKWSEERLAWARNQARLMYKVQQEELEKAQLEEKQLQAQWQAEEAQRQQEEKQLEG